MRVEPQDWPEALADVDGYQMVVAGPGAGKTEFLVRRAAELVKSGKARRDEIVALCFSRRASADLRARFERAAGAGGVPVDITTFHSLALRTLEIAGERPIPLTTPEQVAVVADLLGDEDPRDWPVTWRGALRSPAFAAEAADFLLRCSERLLTPEGLAERAERRRDWRGLPGLFDRYLRRLADTGRTDYGALLVSTVQVLRTDRGREAASRYRYALADEYQDTSPVQAEMASLLAASHGNLTVAGDPYQSIYSFRGAELGAMRDFPVRHKGSKRITLSPSFRAPKAILDSALRVVSRGHLPGAAGPVGPAPHQGRSEAFIFDQETAEAEWIAKEVERSLLVEGVPPSAIAVLVRSKRELAGELSRALERRGVPHDPPESRLVDHPAVRLIQDVVAAARAESQPEGAVSPSLTAEGDRAMRRILLGPMVALSLGEERALVRERQRTEAAWSTVVRDNLPGHAGLADLVDSDEWATEGSAVAGLWRAWESLDGLPRIVSDPERSGWRRAWSAFAQVLARQAERDSGVSLARFFELAEEEDFEAIPLISHRSSGEQVTLTTLHQAKGLEFDVVFIAGAVEGVFPDLRRRLRMLRPELLSTRLTTDTEAQRVFRRQEEMRLAYTAMTRARLRVVWTATDAGADQSDRRPSRFLIAASGASSVDELGPPSEDIGDPVTLSEAETRLRRELSDPAEAAARRLAAAAVLADPPGDWWDPTAFPGATAAGPDSPILGETVRLSPSQAESYRRCPRLYALERRLRLGDASSSPHARFGALIHATLERAEREVVGTGATHAGLDRALDHLEQVWDEEADFGSPELTEAWRAKGRETIVKLYENWPPGGGSPFDLERKVELAVAGVTWVGRIDRVEQAGDGLRVIDYKTSVQPATRSEAADSIQLGFYAEALEEQVGRPVTKAQLWYPRAKTKSLCTRSLDPGERAGIREEMERITAAVLSEDWAPRAGGHCERCAFRRSCPAWSAEAIAP